MSKNESNGESSIWKNKYEVSILIMRCWLFLLVDFSTKNEAYHMNLRRNEYSHF